MRKSIENGRTELFSRSSSDGWRGIIGDTFTMGNIRRLGIGIARYLKTKGGVRSVFVGYDTRFLSDRSAGVLTQVLAGAGIRTVQSSRAIPTPVVSFFTHRRNYDLGVSITASHNPYYYNGVKIRMPFGGAPPGQVVERITSMIPKREGKDVPGVRVPRVDPTPSYIGVVRSFIDRRLLAQRKQSMVVDAMHGTTAGLLSKMLEGTKVIVHDLHSDHDPYFGGCAPEPQANTVHALAREVRHRHAAFGVEHDGDGDRIVAFHPRHGFLSPHDLLCMFIVYLVEYRHARGMVLGSATITRRAAQLAQHYRLDYREFGVGFYNAAAVMRDVPVVAAGEDNGGIGIGSFLPERDGTFNAALLCEANARVPGGLSALVRRVEQLCGRTTFVRLCLPFDRSIQGKIDAVVRSLYPRCTHADCDDGMKYRMSNGDWVYCRASGTEPLVRVYLETRSRAASIRLVRALKQHCTARQ